MNQDELQNTVLCGDALEMLKRLPDEYVQMCVTSPPYYGLRDYGAEGQIGCEQTPLEYIRKYGAYASGITQNVDDLLQSHTARTMLANSEFIIMLNQASTDRIELAKLLNISDTQLSYITNVDAGHGLIKVGSSLVPFANKFPKNTKLYKLMTTKLSDIAN